ncbi:MAG: hypothetical protein K0Q72_4978 [Armatimonadetes bacterium]|nr:hypothetical protein [Armatimonadota bacterium]
MVRRPVFWAAFALVAAIFCLGAAPARSQTGMVSWVLLGGKGKAAKAAGLQVFAESGNLDHSILYRNNAITWSNGFIVSDEECPEEHFHGRLGDLKDNGRGCGLGTVSRYTETAPAVQHASDALMSNLEAQGDLANVHYRDAVAAAEVAAGKLIAMKAAVLEADPSQLPGGRVALPSVNTAIDLQTRAVEILTNLAEQTSNRHAIRRSEIALRQAEKAARKAFSILVNR